MEADDEDFTFATSSIGTKSGTATTSNATWTKVSGDAEAGVGTYTVNSGDTATFEISYNVTGPGSAAVTISSVAGQEVPTDKQYSGLEAF